MPEECPLESARPPLWRAGLLTSQRSRLRGIAGEGSGHGHLWGHPSALLLWMARMPYTGNGQSLTRPDLLLCPGDGSHPSWCSANRGHPPSSAVCPPSEVELTKIHASWAHSGSFPSPAIAAAYAGKQQRNTQGALIVISAVHRPFAETLH